jgi:Tfp pilus assembly protein PilN
VDFSTRPAPSSHLGWLATGVLSIAVALALWVGFDAWAALGERQDARAAVDALRSDLAASERRITHLEARRRGEGERLAARARLTIEAPPHRVLSDLSVLLPPDVRLSDLVLVYDSALRVEARLVSRRAAAYDAFLDRLVASPLFSEVTPGPEAREGELRATVSARYRAGDAP